MPSEGFPGLSRLLISKPCPSFIRQVALTSMPGSFWMLIEISKTLFKKQAREFINIDGLSVHYRKKLKPQLNKLVNEILYLGKVKF